MTDEEKIKEIREAVLKFYDEHPEVGIVAGELVSHHNRCCCGMGAWVVQTQFEGSLDSARKYDCWGSTASLNVIVARKFGGEFSTRFEGGFDDAVTEHVRKFREDDGRVFTVPGKAGATLARELIAKGVKVYY